MLEARGVPKSDIVAGFLPPELRAYAQHSLCLGNPYVSKNPMTTNFSFFPAAWHDLTRTAAEAERQVYAAPMYAAMLCRKSLEEWVRWIYEHDGSLEMPHDTSLNALLHAQGSRNW